MFTQRGLRAFYLIPALLMSLPVQAEDMRPLEEIEVRAARLDELPARDVFALTVLSAGDLALSPSFRLDAILGDLPGVSLFRRASSLAAHPTTQGLTLRALGPNGAGRALVLRDGVPLNDPFGGWVHWSAIDSGQLEQVRIEKGSGAGPYGNQALSGVVRLESRAIGSDALEAEFRGDSFGTVFMSGSAALADAAQGVGLRLSGRHFDSDGFRLLPEDSRGPVDARAASGASAADLEGVLELGPRAALRARLGWFREERVNGLALATNNTEGYDASLSFSLDGGSDRPSLEVSGFWQHRAFENRFAAVLDAARSEARLVLDQFDVPATGFGGRTLLRMPLGPGVTIEAGFDARRLEGETNELFRNIGAGFTRLREAGGDQLLLGGWAEIAAELTDRLALSGGVRLDRWKISDGRIREFDHESGALLLDDEPVPQSGTLPNARLGARYRLTGALGLRMAAYSGWRLPTINELFRPFRVGNDVTEANPSLMRERLFGLEGGLEYRPLNSLGFTLDLYRARLEDAVGNVTLALGPGVFPPAGFIPEDGSLRMRRNIDRVRAQGLELSSLVSLADGVSLDLRYTLAGARVRDFAEAPDLVGKRLPQAPKHDALMVFSYVPEPGTAFRASGRYLGGRFEDDSNSRRLPDSVLIDLSLVHELRQGLRLELAVENLLDRDVASQIDGAGLVFRAEPRAISATIRVAI